MPGQKIKERILLFRVRRFHDKEAFGELYDIYADSIFRFVYLKLRSREVAEDIASEVFLKIWNILAGEDEAIENFRPFLYKVARNSVIDFYRQNKQDVFPEASVETAVDETNDLAAATHKKEMRGEVEAALQKLKAEYREAVALRYIEEMSVGEIAEVLGKSQGATRVLLHRAMNALKEMVGESEVGC